MSTVLNKQNFCSLSLSLNKQPAQAPGTDKLSSPKASAQVSRKIIHLPSVGENMTIAIVCPLREVPKGVQVTQASGGNFNPKQQQSTTDETRYSHSFVDFDGLLSRISIDSVNTVKTSEISCVVYINTTICTPKNSDKDSNPWNTNEIYGFFIKKLLHWRFKTITLKPRQNDFVLNLRGYTENYSSGKVFFANRS